MCGISVASLLISKCLVLLRKKTAKTPCIIALKLSIKRLSSNLYKCQIPFIKKYTLTMHSMCLGIERTTNIH